MILAIVGTSRWPEAEVRILTQQGGRKTALRDPRRRRKRRVPATATAAAAVQLPTGACACSACGTALPGFDSPITLATSPMMMLNAAARPRSGNWQPESPRDKMPRKSATTWVRRSAGPSGMWLGWCCRGATGLSLWRASAGSTEWLMLVGAGRTHRWRAHRARCRSAASAAPITALRVAPAGGGT